MGLVGGEGTADAALVASAGMVPRDTHDAVADASVTDRIRSILSELEAADFELLDPPAEIWEAIEASITSSPSPRGGTRRRVTSLRTQSSSI